MYNVLVVPIITLLFESAQALHIDLLIESGVKILIKCIKDILAKMESVNMYMDIFENTPVLASRLQVNRVLECTF